jgi:hypothetical protein
MFQINTPSPSNNTFRASHGMNTSWEQVRREVRAYRSFAQPSNVTNIKDFCFDEKNNRAYFLATDPSRMKTSTLFVVDLPQYKSNDQPAETETTREPQNVQNGTANTDCNYQFSISNEFQVKGRKFLIFEYCGLVQHIIEVENARK